MSIRHGNQKSLDNRRVKERFLYLLPVPIAHEKEQRMPLLYSDVPLVGVNAVRVGQDDVFNKRRLIGPEPTEIGYQKHRIPYPINHLVKCIRVLAHDHVIPPSVLPPVLLAFQPLDQLLLHHLVVVLRGAASFAALWSYRINYEAERGEEGDIEEISVVGVEGALDGGGRGPAVGGIG